MTAKLTIRNIERDDLEAVEEIDRFWNTVEVNDEDFGKVITENPWYLTKDDVVDIVRQRSDKEKSLYDTRTFVVDMEIETFPHKGQKTIEKIGWTCAAYCYEKQPTGFEIVYLSIHPDSPMEEVLDRILYSMMALTERSEARNHFQIVLRDRDEARIRFLIPKFQEIGCKIRLIPNYFKDDGIDGWECVWSTINNKKGKHNGKENSPLERPE